jgi:hypothetical protein
MQKRMMRIVSRKKLINPFTEHRARRELSLGV